MGIVPVLPNGTGRKCSGATEFKSRRCPFTDVLAIFQSPRFGIWQHNHADEDTNVVLFGVRKPINGLSSRVKGCAQGTLLSRACVLDCWLLINLWRIGPDLKMKGLRSAATVSRVQFQSHSRLRSEKL